MTKTEEKTEEENTDFDIQFFQSRKNRTRILLIAAPLLIVLSFFINCSSAMDFVIYGLFVTCAILWLFKFPHFYFFLGWFVLPFIPLFLTSHYTILFYCLLLIYVAVLIYINHFKMAYHWTETIIFIGFFLFCALAMKSLIDYDVINEKKVVKTAVVYGTLE